MKSLGKTGWARSLLEKTGLRRKARNDFEDDRREQQQPPRLQNTSGSARKLAATGRHSESTECVVQASEKAERVNLGEPFPLENLKAFACLWATFLFRWGQQNGKIQAHGMRLLNTLAFYQCTSHADGSGSDDRTSLIHFLWCVLQETRDFEDFAKVVPYAW